MQDEALSAYSDTYSWTIEAVRDCVGPGWRHIVDCIFMAIVLYYPDSRIAQVKEKFGGLRFYVYGEKEIQDLVSYMERLSEKICERCGRAGQIRPGGWVLTLCDNCHEENQERLRKRRETLNNKAPLV